MKIIHVLNIHIHLFSWVYGNRHKSRNLKPLKEGEKVWMSDRKESGTVTRKVAPRSYLVQTSEGEYRRNR